MSFEQRLAAGARDIEAALGALLAGNTAAPPAVPERLAAAMRHAVMAGGKRIRPFLLIESAALFGVPAVTAIPAALALELVHCYSLVHDDLPAMDNDDLRRGRPTVWKAFDDWTAIIAGDALLTLAFEVLAAPESIAPEKRIRLLAELARAAGPACMVGGQCLDLEADKLGQPPRPDRAHIERLQAMKTGALFRFATTAGAVLGGGSATEQAALADFGAGLGLAFQLADDLLDAEGDAATVGKATAKDAAAGKATIVGLAGIDAARIELHSVVDRAGAALDLFADRADTLRAALMFAVERRN